MSFIQAFSIFAFALFSIVDLRSRFIPFIDLYFALTGLWVFPDKPWYVIVLVIIVIWGLSHRFPVWFALPFVFYPIVWPLLLVSYGVRKQMIGKADLFALGIIGLLFPAAAVIIALFGISFWRKWWVRRGNTGFVPAIPGLFFGLAIYSMVWSAFRYLHII